MIHNCQCSYQLETKHTSTPKTPQKLQINRGLHTVSTVRKPSYSYSAYDNKLCFTSWMSVGNTLSYKTTETAWIELTHWRQVMHISIIGSDNGLSPGRRQAIIWTNDGILLTEPLGTNFSEIFIKLINFHPRKCLWNGVQFVSASMC